MSKPNLAEVLNSNYYTVELIVRGRTRLIVELGSISKLARFVTGTEGQRARSHHACEVKIFHSTAGMGRNADMLLEKFKGISVREISEVLLNVK